MHIVLFDYKPKKDTRLIFLSNCPNFLSNKCSSTNWAPNSPCWDCVAKKQYIIRGMQENQK